MKYLDFEYWVKEHKDINNNLAVPLYRAFCKAYGINFHFADEKSDIDHDKLIAIHLGEMPLHGKALSLFNFVNKPYHPFEDGLVSFTYTSWDDFGYENLSLEEIGNLMGSKDDIIGELKSDREIYAAIAIISTLIATLTITSIFTNSTTFSMLSLLALLLIITIMPKTIYKLRKKIEQRKFDRKLLELKQKLKDISDRHGSHNKDKND